MHEQVCIGCTGRFVPTRRDQQHCSVKCRQRAKRDRERQKSVTAPQPKRDSQQPTPMNHSLMALSMSPEQDAAIAQILTLAPPVSPEEAASTYYVAEMAHAFVLAHGGYLELPQVLQRFAEDVFFLLARPYGFDAYIDMVMLDDAQDQSVCVPLDMKSDEVIESIKGIIQLQDNRAAALVPLAWRVGDAVGWLTGLRLHQPDEAQRGLVWLALLVNPLLLSGVKILV